MSTSVISSAGLKINTPGRATVEAFVAGLLLMVLAPLLVMIGVWITLESQGPATVQRAVADRNGRVVYVTDYRLGRFLDRSPDRPADTVIGRILRWTGFRRLPRLLDVKAGRLGLGDVFRA